ncbi:chemotaxis protein CheW (plasmid) [Pontibacillus sp. ALD_SL1]|uniref:chemotaxis protein CheW n=1 Tax=Pontibacillus sp. ALD_SL1 TaxID=2777185 RepID=UPI001A9642BA|nr:chemotaxis protein CheW [Pontibacillus sp. ALD_SL1]QST03008.1 chemotaxis protein CheW [Pontibacillus sp. ALD_SL1]
MIAKRKKGYQCEESDEIKGGVEMKATYMVLQINHEHCALRACDILEVVELDTMVQTKREELHVISWGAGSIPVIDPNRILSDRTHEPTVHSRVVIVEREGVKYGFLTEAVLDVISVDEECIDEPPVSAPRYVCGVVPSEGVRVLNPDAFLHKSLTDVFDSVYGIDLSSLEQGLVIQGVSLSGRDWLIEQTRLKTLNMVIYNVRARGEEDSYLMKELLQMHELIRHLQ